jgi:sugar lactone lactonase YvrE
MGDGGPATSAQLAHPSGVAVDRQGNVYIADSTNNRVRKVSNATITTIAGTGKPGVWGFSGDGGPATSAKLRSPEGVAVDRNGNVYIADTGNNRVRKVNRAGTITTIAGTGIPGSSGDGGPAISAQLWLPMGVALDIEANLYIADTQNNRVRKVDRGGTITTIAGTGQWGLSGDGGPATSAQLRLTTGVAVDGRGNIYIADFENDRVRKVDRGGTITTIAGTDGGFSGDGGPAVSARLWRPDAVAVDIQRNVYIADRYNQRVRKVGPSGTITTIAGTGKPGVGGFSGDGGRATAAYLSFPAGVAVDERGNVYIADQSNQRVRKVTLGAAPRWPRETCTIDYCVPPDWNAHPTEDLPARIREDKLLNRHEPLNVIFSAASDVKIGGILDALAGDSGEPWQKVRRGWIPPRCLSAESADVNGTGRVPQEHSWRVGGCIEGNLVSQTGDENHARLWAQSVPPSGKQAWFATVSFETACLVLKDGRHLAYGNFGTYVLWPWHCVNGGPGSLGKAGYDLGARVLVQDMCRAAKRRAWYASYRKDKRPAGVGQNGVRYSGYVYVLRVGLKPPQPAPSGAIRCGA